MIHYCNSFEEEKQNFQKWYENIITGLFSNPDSGFAILMMVFPILERYVANLRTTKKTEQKLTEEDYQQISTLLTITKCEAKALWSLFRNRILHQLTIRLQHKCSPEPCTICNNTITFYGKLSSGCQNAVTIEQDNSNSTEKIISINPPLFAKKILNKIGEDFSIFIGNNDQHIFPSVTQRTNEKTPVTSSMDAVNFQYPTSTSVTRKK